MLIGVACTVDSRFSAVTTISSNSPPPLDAGVVVVVVAGPAAAAGSASAGPIRVAAHRSADTNDVAIPARASAAHNTLLIYVSPRVKTPNGCAPLLFAKTCKDSDVKNL